MLDVSVRAGILQLLDKLRRDEGVGILMITHDLATAAHVSDRVAVMYHGNLVELGPARTVIDAPQHPYTQALIYAVPRVHREEERVRTLPGEPPDAAHVPSGCRFHPRCPLCEERCRSEVPTLLPAAGEPGVLRGLPSEIGRRGRAASVRRGAATVKVSIGDVSLWFDVLNAGLVTDGPVMREKPVVLALHGGPGFDHTDFKDILEPFFDLAQVVMYDHRGNGRSDDGDVARWNLEQWGDDVHAFCGALGIEKPFVLGWSFGGMVAQSYASHHPDAIGGLMLLSTAPRISEEQFGPVFERVGGPEAREIVRRFLVDLDESAFDEYTRVCLPYYTVKRDPLHLSYRETRPIIRTEVTRHFFTGEAWRMDLRPGLTAVTCPTLILNGVHDPITPPECSDELAAALAGAPVTRVIGQASSHDVPEDEPELFEGAVRDFLSGCLAAREAQ